MARIKIVLTEDIENLGRVGEIVSVRGGYGRNFLIPRGKAMPASAGNLARVAERRKVYEKISLQQQAEASQLAGRMNALALSIARKAGEESTLYGSVTSSDIADLLEAKGILIDKRRVLLPEPIKRLGDYTVAVRLHPEVTAELRLSVVADEG